jgi:hypothetical protein
VAHGLRQCGLDVLTAHEAGRAAEPDPDQLAFATVEERVLVTLDPDFLALHQSGIPHAGLVWCHATKYTIGQLIQRLVIFTASRTATLGGTTSNIFNRERRNPRQDPQEAPPRFGYCTAQRHKAGRP